MTTKGFVFQSINNSVLFFHTGQVLHKDNDYDDDRFIQEDSNELAPNEQEPHPPPHDAYEQAPIDNMPEAPIDTMPENEEEIPDSQVVKHEPISPHVLGNRNLIRPPDTPPRLPQLSIPPPIVKSKKEPKKTHLLARKSIVKKLVPTTATATGSELVINPGDGEK